MFPAEQLLDDVCCADPQKVAAALQAARGRGPELMPGVLARVEDAAANPGRWLRAQDGRSLVFLLFLAAECRETRAHEFFVRLLRLPGDRPYEMFGDLITEQGATILADTYGGDPAPLRMLVDDSAAGPFERGAGLRAVSMLVARGRWERQAALTWLTALAASLQPEKEEDGLFANALVDAALSLGAWELRCTVLGLYDRGLADPGYIGPEYVAEKLAPGAEMEAHEASRLSDSIIDTWDAVRWWSFFQPDRSRRRLAAEPPEPPLAARRA